MYPSVHLKSFDNFSSDGLDQDNSNAINVTYASKYCLFNLVCQANQHADSNECKYILRLVSVVFTKCSLCVNNHRKEMRKSLITLGCLLQGAKEGHLFNEQNFHLRAAKPDAGQPF